MSRIDRIAVMTSARRFRDDDSGSMTIWGLFVFFVCGILGALALDMTHLVAARTHLQVAADQAAHTALYQRFMMDEDTQTLDEVKADAISIVQATLPTGRYGISIAPDDIEFGIYNTQTGVWTADPTSKQAARAITSLRTSKGNAVTSFLFRLIGRDEFDVAAQAIYVSFGKACLREGYVADGIVDIQSNNDFVKGFCIHSNTHVSVNQRNTYEPGTIVSMPNIGDLDIPGGADDEKSYKLNEGLLEALTPGYIDLRVIARVENLIYRYQNPDAVASDYPHPLVVNDTEGWPAYVSDTSLVTMQAKSITTEEILAAGAVPADPENGIAGSDGTGRVYRINCQGNSGLTIDATTTPLNNVIIISPCEISFKNGSAVESARVITTATSADSISATNGMLLGRPGSCDHGAQLLTAGGIRFPAGLEVHGSQMIAKGDIQFAAGANGLTGASFIAGGEIDGTSNGDMGLCGMGMADNIEVSYFRLAR